MITKTVYISDDGIQWDNKDDAEFRDKMLKLAKELERVYEIDCNWLQVAEYLYDNPKLIQ